MLLTHYSWFCYDLEVNLGGQARDTCGRLLYPRLLWTCGRSDNLSWVFQCFWAYEEKFQRRRGLHCILHG